MVTQQLVGQWWNQSGGDQWIRSLYCIFCFDRREGKGEGEGLGCAVMLHCLRDNNFPH